MPIKSIVIDDEPFKHKNIGSTLKNIPKLDILSEFTSPYEGLVEVLDTLPDVVFLETEMKELNGIELANIIKLKKPEIQIVYITKNESYALDAYKIGVLDYLLKPVKTARLNITLARLNKHTSISIKDYKKTIGTFGELHFKDTDNSIITNVRWRTRKTEELFAYLLHNQNRSVQTEFLVEMLWPHVDFEKGMTLLYSAIYQIRKKMKKINFDIKIVNKNNSYMLKLNDVHLDILDWELEMDILPTLSKDTLHEHLQIIKMYKGDYLGKNYYTWAEERKNILNHIGWNHFDQVMTYLISIDKHLEAIRLLNIVKEISSDYEKIYFNLMKLYSLINDRKGVKRYYKKLNSILRKEFTVSPSSETIDWYNSWLKGNENLDFMDIEN